MDSADHSMVGAASLGDSFSNHFLTGDNSEEDDTVGGGN